MFLNNTINNTVGGTASGAGNLISGNNSVGIQLFGPSNQGNVIQGNAIGLDSAGRPVLPNRLGGIFVNTGPQSNQIGGTAAGEANTGQTSPQFTISGFHQSRQAADWSPPARRIGRDLNCLADELARHGPGSPTDDGWRQGDVPARPAAEGDVEHQGDTLR